MGEAAKKKKAQAEQEKLTPAVAILEYMEMFVFAVVFVILLLTFALRLCEVDGPSMDNTLTEGERLLISDLFYSPKQNDIIVFHLTDSPNPHYNKPIVKRVIATGGQFVKIDYVQNQVFVSNDDVFTEDEIIDESGYAYFSANYGGTWREATQNEPPEIFAVPEGKLFVMGDNRNNSADSRNKDIGFVDEECVLGRALCCVMPFSAFRIL